MEGPDLTIPLAKGSWRIGPEPVLVGVLNVTPDSFSDGGKFLDPDSAVKQGLQLIQDGAGALDIGGESTRPGSDPVPADQELERVLPVIRELAARAEVPISIDTVKAEVAAAALEAGAHIINDISGLSWDPEMAALAAAKKSPVIINHMRGKPKTMQEAPRYEDPVAEIREELKAAADRGLRAGIGADKIIVDPGIGFGKRLEDNLEILRRLKEFRSLGYPIFIGTSRKSFLGKILDGRPPEDRIFGTAASVTVAVLGGANLIRVHEPAEMRDAVRVAYAISGGRA